jgi:beta-lactamase superfamily II metal-dependent hydrolase
MFISFATNLVGHSLAVLTLTLTLAAAQSPQLRIYQIDVEQADAALIVSPNTNTLVIDTGLGSGSAQRIKALMDKLGLTQINHLVTSHYHTDHYGGVPDLLTSQGVTVLKAYDRGAKHPFLGAKTNETDFKAYQTNLGNRATGLKPGDTIDLDPTMTVTCISSSGAVIGEQNPVLNSDKDHENDNSVALLIEFGGFRYFTAGDIERHTETNIAAHHLVLKVDACKASHHGSETSSSLELMGDLKPNVIVISNGDHGGFHHPRQIILDRYDAMSPRPKVFQTNKYTKGPPGGNVADEFIGDLETTDDDGTILITAAPSTGQFFVTWRSNSLPFGIKDTVPSSVVIESLMPKPPGPDSVNEQVTVRNRGSVTLSLAGWVLRDESGKVWKLDSSGAVNPGDSKTIQRHGMAMSLKDSGDTIFLIAPDGSKKDEFHYQGSQEGKLIPTSH